MKKLLTALIITVCLSMAAPTFAAPLPVPKSLCLKFDSNDYFVKLRLVSSGKISGIEYFDVNGYYFYVTGGVPVSGTAYRRGKRKLRMSLNGGFDLTGPGSPANAWGSMTDHLLRLDTGKDRLTGMFSPAGELSSEFADTAKKVVCSSLPNPTS